MNEWSNPPACDGCECDCHKPGVVMLHCVACCYPGWRERSPVFDGVEFKAPSAEDVAKAERFAAQVQAQAVICGKAFGILIPDDVETRANFGEASFVYPVAKEKRGA